MQPASRSPHFLLQLSCRAPGTTDSNLGCHFETLTWGKLLICLNLSLLTYRIMVLFIGQRSAIMGGCDHKLNRYNVYEVIGVMSRR